MDRQVRQLLGYIGGGAILLTCALKYSTTVSCPATTGAPPGHVQEMSATVSAACQNDEKLCQAYSKIVAGCELWADGVRKNQTTGELYFYNWASWDKLPFGDGVWAHGDARALFDLETGALCIYDLEQDRVVRMDRGDYKEAFENGRSPPPQDYRGYDNVRVACQSEVMSKFGSSPGSVILKWDNPPFGSARWLYPYGSLVDKEANVVCHTHPTVSVSIESDVDVVGLLADTDDLLRHLCGRAG